MLMLGLGGINQSQLSSLGSDPGCAWLPQTHVYGVLHRPDVIGVAQCSLHIGRIRRPSRL